MSCSNIHSSYLHPIDHGIYKLCHFLTPVFHQWGVTANWITGLALLSGLMGVYMICKESILGVWLWFTLYWIFDAMDGCYARKYNCTSKLGSYLDPISDITIGVLILLTVYYKYGKQTMIQQNPWILVIVTLIVISTGLYYACIDAYQKTQTPHPWYPLIQSWCQKNTTQKLNTLRWFTGYTYIIVIVLVVWWLNQK